MWNKIPLRIKIGPAMKYGRPRWHTRWIAVYWNAHCVSLVPKWYGYKPIWKD